MESRRVLNVGGGNKAIALPLQYADFEHVLLDIDPAGSPDIACDARMLNTLEMEQFDAVYCSHNLEHYYRHDVPKVLAGFFHVLKYGGFVEIRVPDIAELMRMTVERNLDVEDVIYQSPAGPITVLDVLFGYGVEVERSGRDYYAHKTGFSEKSLPAALQGAGFSGISCRAGNLEISAVAFKGTPGPFARGLFALPDN